MNLAVFFSAFLWFWPWILLNFKFCGSCAKRVWENCHIFSFHFLLRYRAIYAYKPQNEDELELWEGDEVYVMEKCDDGWYVGTSGRTGIFGTFPGNYVQPVCK